MKRCKKLICSVMTVVMLFSLVVSASACTTVAVGKDASATGAPMISHSVDGWYDERIEIIPGGKHAAGEMVEIYRDPCQDGYRVVEKVGEIPQVEETYTYFDTGYPFMNEKGVTIGEHTWSGDYASFYNGEKALFVIANLQALGLQRASTAKECVQIMGALAEEYGYADGGETLLVGDSNEIWIFEISGPGPLWTPDSGTPGAHWAARRVPDDEVHSGANRSILREIDFNDPDNYMWSTDITKYPEQLGFWKEGDPFNYSIIFDTCEGDMTYSCSGRVWRVYDLLEAPDNNEVMPNGEQAATEQPFSVKPGHKVTLQDVMALYYDHYEGTPFDMTTGLAAGPWGNPVRYRVSRDVKPADVQGFDWERSIAIYRCSYSFVSEMRPDMPAEIGTVLWYGCDSPDTTVHVPIYAGTTEVPEAWSQSNRWEFDQSCAWWAFNFVNNWATTGWNVIYPDIAAKRDELEGKMFEEQADVDAAALELYNAGDVEGAKAYLTEYVNNTMNDVYDQWWAFAWELVGKYNDGQIYNAEERSTSGFPYTTEYLDGVDYGRDYLAAHEEYLAATGQAPEESEEPSESETPSESVQPSESETPSESVQPSPSPSEAPAESSSNTGMIVGIVVVAVAVIAAAAWFFLKKKK